MREEIMKEVNYLPPKGKSDHRSIVFKVIDEKKINVEQKKILNYKKVNYDAMKEDIKKIKWKDGIIDVENSWLSIKRTIHVAMDKQNP